MNEREKMEYGMVYQPLDEEITREQFQCVELSYEYNQLRPTDFEQKAALLRQMFAEVGEGCYVEQPFHANWGGRHVHFGSHVYANFNLTCVDDGDIYVGDYTEFGPNVTLVTAGHPVLPKLRLKAYQYNLPIHIGRNCWIGAGAVVLPGVTIGDNTVIGAGSVVTRDIPADVVALGTPCRVLRPIGERDREYYYRDKKIDWSTIEE